MTVTVAALSQTVLDACNSITDNDGGGVDSVDFKQNSASVYWILKSSGNNDATFTKATGTWDLSGTKHLRFWGLFMQGSLINLAANGGIQVGVSDGANTGFWYIGGRDTYPGGWFNFCVDVSANVDAGTKPTDMSLITDVIVRVNLTGTAKNFANTWIDYLHITDGLSVYGDDGGSYMDFEDIFAQDNISTSSTVGGWGVIVKYFGIYFLTGKIQFGDSAGTNALKFQAKNQTVVFQDRPVNAALYEFTVIDNGTGTTEFLLGEKSGTAGINGCTITVENQAQTCVVDIVATDADITDFGVYGCTFIGLDDISLPAASTKTEVLNTNFISCGEVVISTCDVENCNFISANDQGVQISSTSHNLINCNFISCGHGMNFSVANTYDIEGCDFVGCTYDVEFSDPTTGVSLTINATDCTINLTSYEITGGGTSVTIINSVNLVITVQDVDQLPIPLAQTGVFLYNSPFTQLMNEDTDTGGIAQESYNYPGTPVDVVVKVRKSDDLDDPRYKPFSTLAEIGQDGLSITVTLEEVSVPI